MVAQAYGPSWPFTGTALPFYTLNIFLFFYLHVGLEWNQVRYYCSQLWPIVPALDE
jgi:hypothetical protein